MIKDTTKQKPMEDKERSFCLFFDLGGRKIPEKSGDNVNSSAWNKWRGFWDRHPILGGVLIMPVILLLVVLHILTRFKRNFFKWD